MSWREERDALIAQTLAFVQSVTGKPADFSQLAPAAPAEPPLLEQSTEAAATAAVRESGPELATANPAAVSPNSITGHPFTSIASQLGLQRDMQAEIRARVASFRANQERFNRERQEYFSTTLARLRASMDEVRHSDE
jgi:hypothetical protein